MNRNQRCVQRRAANVWAAAGLGLSLGAAAVGSGVAGAGEARGQTVFTFAPFCNNNWFGECNPGPPCSNPPGGFVRNNNWGQAGCTGSGGALATPGPLDTAVVGNLTLNINGSINVGTLSTTANTVVNWSSGDFQTQNGYFHQGTFNATAQNASMLNGITNAGTWTNSNGFAHFFQSNLFSNSGTLVFIEKNWQPASGATGTVLNTGTLRVQGNGTFNSMSYSSSAITQVVSGAFTLNNSVLGSTPSATYNVADSALMDIVSCSLTGVFNGTTNTSGTFRFRGNTTISDATTLNFSGAGARWNDTAISVATGRTLTNAGLFIAAAQNGSLVGTIVNTGTWTNNNSFSHFFNSNTFTNATTGTVIWADKNWQPSSGQSGTFINNGAINVTGGGSLTGMNFAQNGTLSIAANQTFFLNGVAFTSNPTGPYQLAAGSLLDMSNCSVSGNFQLPVVNGGQARLRGTTTIPSNTTINATSTPLLWNDTAINITNSATLTNAGLFIAAAQNGSLVGTIVNTGTWTNNNSFSHFFNSNTFTNATTGTVIWADKNWQPSSGQSGTFINNGAINVTGGGSLTGMNFAQNGTLSIAANQTFFLNGVAFTSNPTGPYQLAAGSLLDMSNCSVSGNFQLPVVNGGQARLRGTTTIPSNTTINATSTPLLWNDTAINVASGATLTNAGLFIAAAQNGSLVGTIVNTGTWTNNNSFSHFFSNNTFTNNGTLVFVDKTWQPNSGQTGTLQNTGTLRVQGNGTLTGMSFNTTGITQVASGTLTLNGTAFTSTVNASHTLADTTLLDSANSSFSGVFNITTAGSGFMRLRSTTTLAGNTTFSSSGNPVVWNDSTITTGNNSTLINAGAFRAAAQNASLAVNVTNNGTWSFDNSFSIFFSNNTLTNGANGTVNHGDKNLQPSGGGFSGSIVNQGTYRITAGGAAMTLMSFSNSALFSVDTAQLNLNSTSFTQTAGETRLNGGNIGGNSTLVINGGRLTGAGSIAGNAGNTLSVSGGTVSPGLNNDAAIITVAGNYTQSATSTLEVDLGAPGNPSADRLQIVGNSSAAIGGTLRVRLGTQAAPGQTFTILSAAALSGAFSNVIAPLGAGGQPRVGVTYTPSSVVVTIRGNCPADFNNDGLVNTDDISDFITAYFASPALSGPGGYAVACPGAPAPFNLSGYQADFNGDCVVNTDDISDFITAYFNGPAGC